MRASKHNSSRCTLQQGLWHRGSANVLAVLTGGASLAIMAVLASGTCNRKKVERKNYQAESPCKRILCVLRCECKWCTA